MGHSLLIEKIDEKHLKKEVPEFEVGDTIKVHTRIIEGNKERVQVFTGTVIAKKGSGISETFSMHRVAYGEGMERVFLLHSPRISKVEIVKKGRVRRAKLYYLRGKKGKAAKVQARIMGRKKKVSEPTVEKEITDTANEAKTPEESKPEETPNE